MFCKSLLRDERDVFLDGINEEISFVTNTTKEYGYYKIGGRTLHQCQLESESEMLFRMAIQKLKSAEDVLHYDIITSHLQDHKTYIVDLLKASRNILEHDDANVMNFKDSITHLTDLDELTLGKLALAREGPLYDYLHLYLELLWLLATIENQVDIPHIIKQLSYFSYKCFEKKRPLYSCDCFKKLWLQVQIFCGIKSLDFWEMFNVAMECYDAEFCLHHLHAIAKLQSFDCPFLKVRENIDFLNEKWSFILKDVNEEKLIELFGKVDALLEMWIECPKLDMIYTTWDFYYKRIECFEIKGKLLEVAKSFRPICGYTMFLKMLYRHLEKHQQWNKFRGRIYTRFSNAKFAKLNINGVYNISLLFAVLNPLARDEILKKLGEMLDALPEQTSFLVWNLQISLIQLQLENDKPVVSKEFFNQLTACSQSRTQFNLVSTFANQLETLMHCSSNMNLDQSEFFGPWIQNYVKHCQVSDLSVLLNVLIISIERIVELGAWYEYEKVIVTNVLAPLKKLATSANPVVLVGSLTALIAVNSSAVLVQTVAYFASEAISVGVMLNFFASICKRLGILTQDIEGFVIRVWFQCGLIGESNPDLTRIVLDSVGLEDCADPVVKFIESLSGGDKKETVKLCFANLDVWIAKHLSNPLYTQHIYTFMAFILNSCGKQLYSRSSASNNLSNYIDILLLPTEVQRGIKPVDYILAAIERTWHLYVNAIHNLSVNDPYLERILKNLVVKYIVLFKTRPSPIAKLLGNEKLTVSVLTKINKEFFLQGVSRATDEQIFKAINTLTNILESVESPNIIIANSLSALLEVYMFKSQKPQVLEFLKAVIRSEHYKSGGCTETIQNSLVEVTKKHLPFSTSTFYQMCFVLSRVIPTDMRLLLNKLREEIAVVERKRGQGFDNSLRQGLDKLQTLLIK
ncbi:PREDICTED: uncharacterized protein LOC108558085 [Nicrophorus vespilloides]|uniref:Protein MMS22-like n=1 Tax=Nicrophorus vespilloides TaxID=110193 RepID=A0ABM1M729_NICVS|nr:PREDICTED: uncharacterized protein LOC108558085 [Nicrophorus vespilloides]